MKCFTETIYQRFVDGELNPLLKMRVAGHVGRCGRCRERVDRLKGEDSRIALLLQPGPEAPDLRTSIMERITAAGEEPAHPQRPRLSLTWDWLPAAAVFVLVALFLISLFQNGDSGQHGGEGEVLIQAASVDGRPVQTHVFDSGNSDIRFIWLEKI